ncbi:acyltransferase domain-containing protein, partial [Amycolatopsis sp. SID8362]|uniref:acyltransferase domain-containing protein n=1 Tax=Amycolatopsis sp. SID8362 TaxID=2690346 RepID=UPI00136E3514
VWSLEDACRVVAARARLMQALPAGGAMVSVQAPEAEVAAALAGHEREAAIAAVNGPASVVLSGEEAAVMAITGRLAAAGRKTKRLRVSHAFHSPCMDAVLQDFRRIAEGVRYAPPALPVVSGVTGEPLTAEQACAPEYWTEQVRATVRFADCVTWLGDHGVTTFLDAGPDGVLAGMAAASAPAGAAVVPALRRDQPEETALVTALGRLHEDGAV